MQNKPPGWNLICLLIFLIGLVSFPLSFLTVVGNNISGGHDRMINDFLFFLGPIIGLVFIFGSIGMLKMNRIALDYIIVVILLELLLMVTLAFTNPSEINIIEIIDLGVGLFILFYFWKYRAYLLE